MCYLIPAVVFSCLAQKTSFLVSLRQIWVVNNLFFFFNYGDVLSHLEEKICMRKQAESFLPGTAI